MHYFIILLWKTVLNKLVLSQIKHSLDNRDAEQAFTEKQFKIKK